VGEGKSVCIENKVVLYMRKSERLTIVVNK